MDIEPRKPYLTELIDQVRQGKLALPQFQRNFVWSRDDIADLFVSLLSGHYIGSFLLLKADPENQPFAVRALQGVPLSPDEVHCDALILDGQQRLTAVHYGLYAPEIAVKNTKYPYLFFLDLDALANGELEEAVFSERADQCDVLQDRRTQFTERVLPLTCLREWDDWANEYEDWLIEKDPSMNQFRAQRNEMRPVWKQALDTFRLFQIPVIDLPRVGEDDPEGLAQVCTIFEKINTSGVRLSVFDLLTARLYVHGIDLHRLWEDALAAHSELSRFESEDTTDYSVLVLRAVGLLRGLEVKGKTLINLSPEGFEDDWRSAAEATEWALTRLSATNEEGLGVFDIKWLPYSTMIPVLAAVLRRINDSRLSADAYDLLTRWYWSSVFTERYGGAVESTTYRDYTDIIRAAEDPTFEPEFAALARRQLSETGFSLLDVGRQNAVYKGTMCLVAKEGAKDFRSGDSIEFHELDDHHIFAQAFMRELLDGDGQRVYSENSVNAVVNRTLISSETNKLISRLRPSEYMRSIMPADRMERILRSHFIDQDAQAAMADDDYDRFALAREEAIVRRIRELALP